MTTHTVYFKRFRMELSLDRLPAEPELPAGFAWVPWSDGSLETHAHVKHLSFQGELDSTVFVSLSSLDGCKALMRAIRSKHGFCPAATWLLVGPLGYGGTVQGVVDRRRCGAIQNLGVVPEYRGLGLGTALLLRSLAGFAKVGLKRASLEVTAKNESVVRMYRRVGFRCYKTVYRAVELEDEPALVEGQFSCNRKSTPTPLPTV